MKDNFREIADRKLADVTFTDSMKLNVLASARRKQKPAYLKYAAAAAMLLIMFAAALIYGTSPAPDNIAGNIPGLYQFATDDIKLTVTDLDWSGYCLNISYTIQSKADTELEIVIGPFAAESDSLYAENEAARLTLMPGEHMNLSSSMTIAKCRPGQDTAINFTAKVAAPGKTVSELPVSIVITVPADMRTGTIIKSGETSSNGLFSATINEAVFIPEKTELKMTVSAEHALRSKEEYAFFITLSSSDGKLSETFPLSEYTVLKEDDMVSESVYLFDETLSFAPAEITVTCEWKNGDTSGTADASFGKSAH